MGVKSLFHLMTFFDLRPNNRAIDFFDSAPKVHCNSLEAPEASHFFLFNQFEISKTKEKWPQHTWDIFLKFDLG